MVARDLAGGVAQGEDSVSITVGRGTLALTGVRIGGKGVYTGAEGHTYRGRANDAMADGLGVLTYPTGGTWSGKWSAGARHGHGVGHTTYGAVGYYLYDTATRVRHRGTDVHCAYVRANGMCEYDRHPCAADDVRPLVLMAAALPVAVRHTAWTAAPDRHAVHGAIAARGSAWSGVCSGHGGAARGPRVFALPILCAAGARGADRRGGGGGS
jgi:hypothetical protein